MVQSDSSATLYMQHSKICSVHCPLTMNDHQLFPHMLVGISGVQILGMLWSRLRPQSQGTLLNVALFSH